MTTFANPWRIAAAWLARRWQARRKCQHPNWTLGGGCPDCQEPL